MNEIEQALQDVYAAATKLQNLLQPFEQEINLISKKPFKELGVSDKIKIAQALLKSEILAALIAEEIKHNLYVRSDEGRIIIAVNKTKGN